MRRSGAHPGDKLYVTGALGGASAELRALAENPRRFRRAIADGTHPHLFPIPRLTAGQRLRRLATSAIDLSDGLSTDLRHLCEESGVGAIVEAASLPIHRLAAHSTAPRNDALHGGEDYELLFTAPPTARVPKRVGDVPVTCIGYMTRSRRILLATDGRQEPLHAAGWEHRL
jgi:thiamine-monophosphate kinase